MKLSLLLTLSTVAGLSVFTADARAQTFATGNDKANVQQLEALSKKIDEQNLKLDALSQQILKLQQQIDTIRPGVMIGEATPAPSAPHPAATPAASATAAPAPGSENAHTVAKGETLTSIAKLYKVKVQELQRFNHIENDRALQIGQTILIPASLTRGLTYPGRMMEAPAARQWFLRKHEDGSIFGPVSFAQLTRWAGYAQVSPNDSISSDQTNWIKAPMLPELAMDWIVELTSEQLYGPTTLGAIHEFMQLGEIDAQTFVINSCDATRRQLGEMTPILESIGRRPAEEVAAEAASVAAPAPVGMSIAVEDRIRELERALREERRALAEAEERYRELEEKFRALTERE